MTFTIRYPDGPEALEADLVRTWEQAPKPTEAETFRNMVIRLFGIRGVERVAMFYSGQIFFLVRGPHCWFDMAGRPVVVKAISSRSSGTGQS